MRCGVLRWVTVFVWVVVICGVLFGGELWWGASFGRGCVCRFMFAVGWRLWCLVALFRVLCGCLAAGARRWWVSL